MAKAADVNIADPARAIKSGNVVKCFVRLVNGIMDVLLIQLWFMQSLGLCNLN